jgi:hypothetical protein
MFYLTRRKVHIGVFLDRRCVLTATLCLVSVQVLGRAASCWAIWALGKEPPNACTHLFLVRCNTFTARSLAL